jgi:glutamine synthetase
VIQKETPCFCDADSADGISTTMWNFLCGLQATMPELILMLTPNVNSYKRFTTDSGPVAANWGINNRSTAFRALAGKCLSQRIENRIGGADTKFYRVLAATLAAGLWDIENSIEPAAAASYNAWQNEDQIAKEQRFPETFHDAITKYRNSEIARELFGAEFVQTYAETRAAHEKDILSHVTAWEIERMLEVV